MKKDELVLNSAIIGNEFELGEPNTIVLSLDGEESIKMNKEGFFHKGILVENDEEIYSNFKNWIDLALKEVRSTNERVLDFTEINKKSIQRHMNLNDDWDSQYGLGRIQAYDDIIEYIKKLKDE
jgi:hypothetical protein